MSAPKGTLNSDHRDFSSLAAALKFVQRAIKLDLESCLPAIVEEYDHKNNIATVRPLIMLTSLNPKGGAHVKTPRPIIPEVPVLSLGAGGFHIHFPIKKGDLGWLHACDRDITLFLQSLKQSQAGSEGPSHSFRDSIFVPDVLRQYTLLDEDVDAFVLQSTDGATRVSIRKDHIKITAPNHVEINTPLTHMTGDCHIDGNLTVDMTALVKQMLTYMSGMTGYAGTGGAGGGSGTTIEGPITQTGGGFTTDQDVVAGGISLHNHDHEKGVGKPV